MTILKAILNKLSKMRVFEDNFSDVKEVLKHSMSVCDRWIECCRNLTATIWKSCQYNKWEGKEFVPTSIVSYSKRLSEVYQIRSGREQYGILLKTVKEEDNQAKTEVYSVFVGLEPLQYNPFTEPAWQEAVQQYNQSMSYVDQKTAQILKMHLRQAQSNPRQVKH